jgi:3-deoxy-D-manno-octulosonate 8-phosphate phosphatase (KDO 8-P phosphatase)
MSGKNLLHYFKSIKTFVFDVDGVLTDGTILLLDDGQQARKMNIKDGYALQLAVRRGYRVLILSGADSPAVRARLEKLGIRDLLTKVENKRQALADYMDRHGLEPSAVLFMGDDMPDYESIGFAGLGCAPCDAADEIKHVARYISPFKGGEGCVRDVIEKVLRLNDHWTSDPSISSI